MLIKVVKGFALVILLVGLSACAEIPRPNLVVEGGLLVEELPASGSVPGEWGDLVAVSNSSQFAHLFQLWFQDEQGTIRMVVFDNRMRQLHVGSRVITRD
jgi:hypothetical protein